MVCVFLSVQIQSLEETKSNLETVNDSLRVQVQEKEESMIVRKEREREGEREGGRERERGGA